MLTLLEAKSWGKSQKRLFVEALNHFTKIPMDATPKVYHAVMCSGSVVAYVCTQCDWDHRVATPHLYMRPAFKRREFIQGVKTVFKEQYIPEVKAQGFTSLITSCKADDMHTGQLLEDLGFQLQYVCCACMTL